LKPAPIRRNVNLKSGIDRLINTHDKTRAINKCKKLKSPSLRSTDTLAIRRALQVRSNSVPGGKHTYLRTAALDCRAGFNSTYRKRSAARKDGQGVALPPRTARGITPPPTAAPLPRGEFGRGLRRARRGEGGFETRPYVISSKPIPLLGGVPPAGGGVVSPAGRNPRVRPP
jgi:hypothetical protein